jgi:MFS family permease
VKLPALLKPLSNRSFRFLWLGQSISLLGDQIYFVALTWLTLQLTGSGLALGTVLMTAAIPRAIFMLVGGALSDRVSPRNLMLVSNAIRALLVGLITALVFFGTIQLWHLYALSVAFGTVDAFFYPASRAIIPTLVDKDELETSNALVQGTSQITALIGPAPAGVIIAAMGLSVAFGFNASAFAVAALFLLFMGTLNSRSIKPNDASNSRTSTSKSLILSIREGLHYAWKDPVIRGMLFIIAAIDFSFVGPFEVGLAWLADKRFIGGAAALGLMLSAWGGGMLVGTIAGGIWRLRSHRGLFLLGISAALGICLALVGVMPNVLLAAIVISVMGFGSGIVNIVLISWLQTRTDPEMLGRTMSLIMLASQGTVPFSYAMAGALVDVHTTILFVIAGSIILVATCYSATNRIIRSVE